jgi:peptidyl-prolyl cis-trans isomerase SurA
MRFSLIFTLLAFFGLNVLNSQSNTDPVLFTIDGQPVLASEFSYIYAKNNREDADFSQNSLEEYLDLYTKFKLKVREAYAMGLDTLPQLQSELAGYRKQLAESYLTDKEITDRLVQEAYTRMQEDVHVAHILFKTNPNVATDTLAAYTKAQAAYKRLKAGETWDVVTKATSEDGGSKDTGGDIGFVTALLPNGFYAFENAAYDTPVGQYSAPVRTTLGYHIVKVIGKRPARGEMDVAHILARVKTDGSDDKIKKAKIDSIYTQIKGGAKFDELARKLSEDKTTAERGGAIGPIAINQYEKAFEEAAFGLANDGDYSAPVRTRLGWHIIKRTRKRPALTFDQAKRKIETQISKDERITSARQAMVTRIKKEAGFTIDSTIYKQFVANAGPDLQTYKWQVPNVPSATIMTLGADKYTNQDFGNYIRNNARTRMSLPKGTPNKDILDKVFNEFVNEKALFFEEKNLSVKYPEFKSLMREYEEGILLFEATKINVWDKASKDSTGLEAYHAAHLNDYMWDERVEVATVTMDSASMDKLATVKKWAAKKPIATVEEMAAKKKIGLQVSRKIYQKDDTLPEGLTRTAGAKADLPEGKGFVAIDKIIPPTPKTLDEARGYIIADYQDQLEKDWVASLQAKYPIQVNESVLNSLVKK